MGANGRVNMVQKEMPVLMLLGLCYLVFTHGVKDRPTQVIRCALHERDREDGQIGLIGMEDKPAHKHSVKVVKNAIGDVFDCVEISKQPAFNHPLLKNHTIQMRPTFPPDATSERTSKSMISEIGLSNETCPTGTIPIIRTRKQDVAPVIPIPNFEVKNGSMVNPLNSTMDGVHYFAQIRMLRGKYYGSIADLNVYGISPISVNQHSATAIWIVNDGDGIRPLEIIIVGWIVHPQLYGDTHTRFFTYWNHAVGSQNGGCFDLLCSGFVQVSSTISLGGILSPLSDYDGHQYVIRILIFKDPSTENWWLLMGKDVMPVGYWPKSLFNSLSGHANKIYWGGAVFTPKNERSPPMGDGCFIEYGPACFIAKLKLVGKRNRYRDISDDERHYYQNKPMCYDIGYFEKRKDGRYFPFGGPGGC